MNGNAAFSPYHAAHRLAEYNNHALSTVFNYCPAASTPVSAGRLLLLSMPALLLLLLRQPLDASPHKKLINLFMNICGAQRERAELRIPVCGPSENKSSENTSRQTINPKTA